MTNKKEDKYGFDAFFEVMTSSPEYDAIMGNTPTKKNSYKETEQKLQNNDFSKIVSDMEEIEDNLKREDFWALNDKEYEQLKKDNEWVLKAWEIMSAYKDSFISDDVIKNWENPNLTYPKGNWKKTGNSDDENKEEEIEIRYFKNTDPEFFGFKWVAGMKDLLEELKTNFINPLKFKFFIQKLESNENNNSEISEEKTKILKKLYSEYKKFKVGIPTGMLFYWPPWTGKTFLTKKLAQELWAGFIKKSAGEFGSSYVHQTSKNIRNFFTQAKKASEKWPIILFLDEIDSLVSKRTGTSDAGKAEEVSQFLQEFNALEDAENLIIIAATNRPDHLDSAILRSGRFDKKIYIWAPDFEARKEMFKIYIERKGRPHSKLDYDKLAELTDNYVSSDIETICDDVSRWVSKGILDLVDLMQDWDDTNDFNFEDINSKLEKNIISQELLEKSIIEHPSSINLVDMSIYENWLIKIN